MSSTKQHRTARKRGPKSATVRNVLTAGAALVAVVALLAALDWAREPAEQGLAVIGVEARERGVDALSADAQAQLVHAAELGREVLVTPVADGQGAGTFGVSFACAADATDLRCRAHQDEAGANAQAALGELLARSAPDRVDMLSVLRHTAEHLAAHPVDGDVDVYLNITGRHDDAQVDLGGVALADRVDEIVGAAKEHNRLPESCEGWRVHVVVASTGDPVRDRDREVALAALVEDCGATLETVTQRWVADGLVPWAAEVPDAVETGEDGAGESGEDENAHRDWYSLAEALFAVGSADLRPGADDAIDEVAGQISAHLEAGLQVSVSIHGYADGTGPDGLNDRLSQERADAVADALADRVDLPEGAVTRTGHGSLPDDGTDEARQHNRRVDVVVTAH